MPVSCNFPPLLAFVHPCPQVTFVLAYAKKILKLCPAFRSGEDFSTRCMNFSVILTRRLLPSIDPDSTQEADGLLFLDHYIDVFKYLNHKSLTGHEHINIYIFTFIYVYTKNCRCLSRADLAISHVHSIPKV